MKTFPKKLIIVLVIVMTAVLALYYGGLSKYLSLESIKHNAEYLKDNVEQNYYHSVAMFIGISTALLAFTLPITAPLGVVGGFLFGVLPGIVYSMIAALLGTAISFLVVRYAMSHIMRNQYGQQLASFNERMKSYGYTYLITLQLLTVVPYFVINTLAALAGVSFMTFMFTTAVGSFPIIAIYAFAGRQLYRIHSWKDIISTEMLLLLVLLAGLAILPMIIRKLRGDRVDIEEKTQDHFYDDEHRL